MSTLFLIQSDFTATPQAIEKLKMMYCPEDVIILMGDAVQFYANTFLQALPKIYLLEADAESLNSLNIPNIEIIQYHDFAEICLQHTRCISLK
ncbi:DsrH/TusB family sulfur metabolism protein [Acinetobacter equi]|uniref:Sulfur relay protein TusB n=1 Tax=Acinetobacter equi TaxID=1324350 RepID=A0A0N9WFD9_9GAMM|nr:DsrH/TusB family sulfur metabolism protein [Acinetobacter equi]ALH96150.1 sulfur relay protein TusB [Acinetobacter equi]